MTPDEMRVILGVGSEVSDAEVAELYAAYLDGGATAINASPDAAMLRLRYPAFAGVSDQIIAYWIADAGRIVTDWGGDTEPATLALAAHNMAANRVSGIAQDAASQLPAGVTSFRSGAFSATVTEAGANRSIAGGYAATPYGQEYAVMLRRNRGGARLVGGGGTAGYGVGVGYQGLPGYGW